MALGQYLVGMIACRNLTLNDCSVRTATYNQHNQREG